MLICIGVAGVSGPVQCLTVCVQGTGSSLKGFIAAVVNDSGELLPDARKVTTFTLDTDWLKPGILQCLRRNSSH